MKLVTPCDKKGSVKPMGLSKAERLKSKREFSRVFSRGRRVFGKKLTLILLPRDHPPSRIGLAVGRKTGKAVRRNRIKRLLREAYRLHKHRIARPHDLILLPRSSLQVLRLAEVEPEVVALLQKSGICC